MVNLDNPFVKNGQILPVASINSVYVDNVKASDLFRPEILVEIIEENRDKLMIPSSITGNDLLYEFDNLLNSENAEIKNVAIDLAKDFGDRLAMVLLTLKKPSELSVKNRKNWNEIHWNYWKTINKIYLVGGLTSPIITKIFYDRIKRLFKENDIHDFRVSFIEGSSHLGTKGLSTECQNGEYLLFDFGQTNIKRKHYVKENNYVVSDSILPTIKSDYLFYKSKSIDEVKMIAKSLHDFIIDVIMDTVKITDFKGDKLLLSIANYVYDGKIYLKRGGYGKLAYLSDNYQVFLSNEVSKELNRKVYVKLYHDTSSMGLNFKDLSNTAVISLGTAFGIAFVE